MPHYPEDYILKENDPRYIGLSDTVRNMTSDEWFTINGMPDPIDQSVGTGGALITLSDQSDGTTAYVSRDLHLNELCITILGKAVYLNHEQAVALANFIISTPEVSE